MRKHGCDPKSVKLICGTDAGYKKLRRYALSFFYSCVSVFGNEINVEAQGALDAVTSVLTIESDERPADGEDE